MNIILNISLPSLGIDRICFNFPFDATIPAKSIYNLSKLYDLVQYDTDGNLYDFVDDFVDIYVPSEPTKESSLFIKIKPIFFAENDVASFYLSWDLSKFDNIPIKDGSVCFKASFKNSNISYDGCIITKIHYIKLLESLSSNTYTSNDNVFWGREEIVIDELCPKIILQTLSSLFKNDNDDLTKRRFIRREFGKVK
jgi:hypothetical protein